MAEDEREEDEEEELEEENLYEGEYTLQDYFHDFDRDFINIDKAENETFQYKSTDVLIQSHWELPIIVTWPKSKISFEFSSKNGDLSFGIFFVPALEEGQEESELEVESIEDLYRTESGSQTIKGFFDLPMEGVIFFMWDNAFDYFANKQLSYKIDVMQPSFTTVDAERCERAMPELLNTFQDIDTAYLRLQDAEDFLMTEGNVTLNLEAEIKAVEDELLGRREELVELVEEETECLDTIEWYFERISGVGIRCLNKHLLSVVFGFIPRFGAAGCVNKYWREIAKETRVAVVSSSEKSYYSKSDMNEVLGKFAQGDGLTQGSVEKERNKKSSNGAIPAPRFQIEAPNAQLRQPVVADSDLHHGIKFWENQAKINEERLTHVSLNR
jgi:hypothetical protein